MDSEGIQSAGEFKKRRLGSFYKNGNFFDCSFQLGQETIHAHRILLAASSPVFEKMLFGDNYPLNITITDAEPQIFRQVLDFLYFDKIYIKMVPNAWKLFCLADKYEIQDLMDICIKYIEDNISMTCLALSYEYSELYNLQRIKEKCLKDMFFYVKGVFASDYHMKRTTLQMLMSLGLQGMTGFEIVSNLVNWALRECELRNIPHDNVLLVMQEVGIDDYIKKIWGDVGKCSRCLESLAVCLCNGILVKEVMQNFMADHQLPTFTGKENLQTIKCDFRLCRFRKVFKIQGRLDLFEGEAYVTSLYSNKDVVLFGFIVNTPLNASPNVGEYWAQITVEIKEANCKEKAGLKTVINMMLPHDAECYIPLQQVVILKKKELYNLIISFSTEFRSNFLSVHTYYMSDTVSNIRNDVSITFSETSGCIINGLCFYPA